MSFSEKSSDSQAFVSGVVKCLFNYWQSLSSTTSSETCEPQHLLRRRRLIPIRYPLESRCVNLIMPFRVCRFSRRVKRRNKVQRLAEMIITFCSRKLILCWFRPFGNRLAEIDCATTTRAGRLCRMLTEKLLHLPPRASLIESNINRTNLPCRFTW